ncbi:MAG: DNA cytosine methyltransferase [Prevotella sp.]|nr:DNA cytosine methyltransferase [Alistipes senegalensis]MCM1358203.1 DNA cytosine methyltransferase [Prevotella sp.]MCM1472936.1 DNA cytosine methyltransferase [Muribaculaceae bacterium]
MYNLLNNNQEYVDTSVLPKGEILKVISLFSGCGGMDLGFKGDFNIFDKFFEKNPYDIIFANDILQRACDTYTHNFNHKACCCDIKELDYSVLPKADIVIGGFPCQDFSLAGKRKGLDADRGRLYIEMKKVIEYIKPMTFVAENVDGIRRNKAGNDTSALDVILDDFRSLEYNVVYRVLNAADYGVPQNRIRVIIVGIRNDLQKKIKYPAPTNGDTLFVTAKDAIDDLWDMIDKTQIKNHTSKDYSKAKFYPGKTMQGNCQIKADKPAPTIRSEHHGNIEGHYRTTKPETPDDVTGWRRLSVRECARLQTFPDNFEFPVSSSDAYKQIGNAVPPVLAWHIARALYISLFT